MDVIINVKKILEKIVSSKNSFLLEECLEGKHLPTLGDDGIPADILFKALNAPLFDHRLATKLSDILGKLLIKHFDKIKHAGWYIRVKFDYSDL
ncbi:hypothetical protein K8R61_00150, partial [bacterium]|nr:hypothetical protein [bacterium]